MIEAQDGECGLKQVTGIREEIDVGNRNSTETFVF